MDIPPQAITAEAREAARDAARPYAADIAAEVVTSLRMAGAGRAAEIMIAKIIGAGLAKAVAAALEAATPHLAAAERERIRQRLGGLVVNGSDGPVRVADLLRERP